MYVSVAICTWNRCELLRQTLEHMAAVLLVPSEVTWELLVVNNNSTDATDVVIDSFRSRLPVRRLYQPLQGHSNARNLAVSNARGDYVVWTDDDVLVDAHWLAEYCRAFERWPEAAIFGGPIEPWFPDAPPAWLQEMLPSLSVAYALRDLGGSAKPLAAGALPFGANMAVRAREQRLFLYDTALGHHGRGMVGGEETQVLRSILASGGTGWWVPEARVRHVLPAERQTVAYLRSYYIARGSRLHVEPHSRDGLLDLPGWVLQAVFGELGYQILSRVGAPRGWVRALRPAAIAQGYVSGVRANRRRIMSRT